MAQHKAPAPTYLGPGKDSGGGNMPIDRIVLHGTVSPTVVGGARDIAAYFRNPNARGSAHYVVDPAEVVQAVWDSKVAWHAPPNPNSLGVELCDWVGGGKSRRTPLPLKRWNDKLHTKMLKRAARLVAELCLAYDVPVRMVGPKQLRRGVKGICEHSDVSKAFGQSTHWDLGQFPRKRFLRLVEAEVAEIKGDTKTAEEKRKYANARVTKAYDLLVAAYKKATRPRRKEMLTHSMEWLEKLGGDK